MASLARLLPPLLVVLAVAVGAPSAAMHGGPGEALRDALGPTGASYRLAPLPEDAWVGVEARGAGPRAMALHLLDEDGAALASAHVQSFRSGWSAHLAVDGRTYVLPIRVGSGGGFVMALAGSGSCSGWISITSDEQGSMTAFALSLDCLRGRPLQAVAYATGARLDAAWLVLGSDHPVDIEARGEGVRVVALRHEEFQAAARATVHAPSESPYTGMHATLPSAVGLGVEAALWGSFAAFAQPEAPLPEAAQARAEQAGGSPQACPCFFDGGEGSRGGWTFTLQGAYAVHGDYALVVADIPLAARG